MFGRGGTGYLCYNARPTICFGWIVYDLPARPLVMLVAKTGAGSRALFQ